VNQEVFQTLLCPSGQEVIQAALDLAPEETDFLRHFTTLSRLYPSDLARAALEIAILRKEGMRKFPFAERIYMTRPSLEQASNYLASMYRAMRYSGFDRIMDLGCSIGGDTLSLATAAPTYGIDLDPLRLAMAQANLAALNLNDRVAFIQADLSSNFPISLPTGTALFFDPSRRTKERRIFSVNEYRPPLKVIQSWLPVCPALGVKISPGVRLEEIRSYDAEVEFISIRGELKEAVLWFGLLKTAQWRATVLSGAFALSNLSDHGSIKTMVSSPGQAHQQGLPLSEPLDFLYEPDPSILRSGLVHTLGEQLDAAQLDPDIAYLTSHKQIDTPFARVWKVESWHPFGVKRLRELLRKRGIRKVVVKKRGSPLRPETLIHALHLEKDTGSSLTERTLFLTHLRGQPIVVVCFPLNQTP
jgi:hypothetical protein